MSITISYFAKHLKIFFEQVFVWKLRRILMENILSIYIFFYDTQNKILFFSIFKFSLLHFHYIIYACNLAVKVVQVYFIIEQFQSTLGDVNLFFLYRGCIISGKFSFDMLYITVNSARVVFIDFYVEFLKWVSIRSKTKYLKEINRFNQYIFYSVCQSATKIVDPTN